MPVRHSRGLLPLLALCAALAGCGDDDPRTASPASLDASLATIVSDTGLDGDPADGLAPVKPADDPLVKLGQILFFSKTLGGTFDSACATCHHPDFAGGDLLSLPVGVSAVNPDFLGPGRLVDHARDYDPLKDGGPNVPRNSQTIINATLYRHAMFFDGRVSFLPPPADPTQDILTPESGQGPDSNAGPSLLEAQARFPVTSGDEMRNFFHPELTDPEAFRQRLVDRLKGLADTAELNVDATANWLALFRSAFNQPAASADTPITYPNIQKALAAYERSQTFTDTAWKQYVQGNATAIATDAKRGALLFFLPKDDGGLGCASCHSGDFFSNEQFYNVGFPQIGRGKRVDARDFGRWQVTKREEDKFAFRVPNLLNVTTGAPYGHAGTFQTLAEVLRYHANPVAGAASFDYTLQHLMQFNAASGNTKTYTTAQPYTQEAIDAPNLALDLLPGRALTDDEVTYLSAFLATLTDPCVQNASTCLADWTPAAAEDPDGNLLVRSFSPLPPAPPPPPEPPVSYPEPEVALGAVTATPRTAFADMSGCSSTPTAPLNGSLQFVERGVAAGLDVAQAYPLSSWLDTGNAGLVTVLMGAGVSATFLDDDCLPDLVWTTGDNPGLVTYLNQGSGVFQQASLIGSGFSGILSGIAIGDLNGDYRRELILGNLNAGPVRVLQQDDAGVLQLSASLPMSRSTFGIALGDVDGDNDPDLYFGHWDYRTLPGTAPAFWRNLNGASLLAADGAMGTSTAAGNAQIWQFTPTLVDFDQDGWSDLLIAADFGSTKVMRNVLQDGKRAFQDVTDRNVVTDENGMGSAFGDYDNDGDLDWFVSSVSDTEPSTGNWGITGNRLYRNDSTPGSIALADATESAGVRDGLWGWGACFADVDNDGWQDLFQVDGFGYFPVAGRSEQEQYFLDYMTGVYARFATKPGRLFINNRNGGFSESATAWGIDLPMDGRGIVCADLDRDGDIDIVVLDHSRRLKYFENRAGHGTGRGFVALRLQGVAPNTEALGARVYVRADLDNDGTIENGEEQMRVVGVHNHYNSQSPLELHFGVGAATTVASLRIVWPDGQEEILTDQAINRFLVMTQP